MSDLKFNCALIHVFDLEGGLSEDPDDPGGVTKYGISQRQYPTLDIRNLTMQDATDIYYRDYWLASFIDLIDDGVLCKIVFAAMANVGVTRAIKLLQNACNLLGAKLDEDGIIGPQTSTWINKFRHHNALIMSFKYNMAKFYFSLKKPKYIVGWLKRLEE